MDSSTRRAFPLDSRTVWVEQQLVGSSIVARDNLVLGPGEYDSKILERHVSTPSLGGPKKGVDFFPSFYGDINVRTPLGKGSPSRARSPSKRGLNGSSVELRDFSTVYQEHDSRNPFDPKNGFCPTPGSYLTHTPALKMLRHDGMYEAKTPAQFGANCIPVPFGERCPTRPALPDYDPKFDSAQVRPATTLGSFQKSKRIHIPSAEEMKNSEKSKILNGSEYSNVKSPNSHKHLHYNPNRESKMSVFQMRCNSVPLPKLKYRTPPVLIFDDSSYKNSHTSKPLDLNPSLIDRTARVHLYNKIVAIPRKHHSTGVSAGTLVVRPSTVHSPGSSTTS